MSPDMPDWADLPPNPTGSVLAEVEIERHHQNDIWGDQNWPDGTGVLPSDKWTAGYLQTRCRNRFDEGIGSWRDIMQEALGEAYAESDPAPLRDALIRLSAVAVAWAESIDRRGGAR